MERVDLLECLAKILSFAQGMDAIKRRVGSHVERETLSWLPAFNLDIALAHFLSALVHNITITDNISAVVSTDRCAIAVDAIFLQLGIFAMRCNWEVEEKVIGDSACKMFKIDMPTAFYSFHAPLNRFLSVLITHLAVKFNIPPATLLRFHSRFENESLAFVDIPLRILALDSQIRIGMWRRNGQSVGNQSHNYNRRPLSLTSMDVRSTRGIWSYQ